MSSASIPRRAITRQLAATGALALVSAVSADVARARADRDWLAPWIAGPPKGFSPFDAPGYVVQVSKGTDFASVMQPNQLWPRLGVAKVLLERALMDLTGEINLVKALGRLVHPSETVALKVNGIAGQTGHTMAFNFEFVLPLVEALLQLGVKAERITVFEQFPNFLAGSRVNVKASQLPAGVKAESHNNRDAKMPQVRVFHSVKTRYVRQVTDASAVIDLTMMKDHSICGFTGALKNMSHGQIVNPQDHHAHGASPQIALLNHHPVLRSRVRLHLVDAMKIIYDEGPLDKNPVKRVPHGSFYASTDPVAIDRVGWKVIDDARLHHKLKPLDKVKRTPRYILAAAELGLGVARLDAIRLRSVNL